MSHTAFKSLTLEEMLEKVQKYEDDPAQLSLIRRAGEFAEKAHEGPPRFCTTR